MDQLFGDVVSSDAGGGGRRGLSGWPECGVPILSQARDLGIVRSPPGDSVLKMNAFKLRGTVLERVQVDHAGRSSRSIEMGDRVPGHTLSRLFGTYRVARRDRLGGLVGEYSQAA
jgi:hypothetical protein